MKMSNMLYIKVEQVGISQASEGHLDHVSRTRTWIKKKIRKQHQFISLVKVVICWVSRMLKERKKCVQLFKIMQEAFHWAH